MQIRADRFSVLSLLINMIYWHNTYSNRIIENSVVGEPDVDCGLESITVDVTTENPFFGRLYIQGESNDPNCVVAYHDNEQQSYATATKDQTLRFSLKFGECNMRRERTLSPRGVAYTFALIVSFHPIFETEVDRAYRIRCFFSESVKTLEATMDVRQMYGRKRDLSNLIKFSQLTTQIVEQEFTLPSCAYEIREGRDGPHVKFAHIGDRVWHVWHCDLSASAIYGILIHSCHVDDGQGMQVAIIDNKGCVVDPLLLSDVEYDDQTITAYAETRVFKYSDKVQLYFTCTIQLCFKGDGGCDGITPPICGSTKYPLRSVAEFPSLDRDHRDDPLKQDEGKQFFGPIDTIREEISRNLHFTPPLPPKPPTIPPEFDFLKGSKSPHDLSVKRQIRASHNFVHELNPVNESNIKQYAETDLTARVMVFPMTENQPSSGFSTNKQGETFLLLLLMNNNVVI
ncbi:unnamed protein product [Thelazia callipaeda]|uniref:ZP domain-containing protein n=1 Tax=Thelazia callipaeda TaxID=103827 RepID=A0A0N5D979_THECL|nr:unnamed protein product [Thelazia callipaeda]